MKSTEVNVSKLIEAVAYGDAAGLSVETKSASEIKAKYGRIEELLEPVDNPFYVGEYPKGTWSDDTQLTLAVAEGLIVADGFDMDAQAEMHIKGLDETPTMNWKGEKVPRGFGKSTFHSIERLKAGVPPLEAGEPGGAGNGVIMKLGPLAAWAAYQTEGGEIYQDVEQLTLMTHNSELAIACSQIHMDVLRELASARDHSLHKDVLRAVIETSLATHRPEYPESVKSIKESLRYIMDGGDISRADIFEHTDGKGFKVDQTLAMVYGAFLHKPRFPESVYGAVNLGGDTDSTAAIIAVMSLFLDKDVQLPEDAKYLKDRQRLVDTGVALAKITVEDN